jgi:hypothetical protein
MGHSCDDMASIYCERIRDDRLRAVADHVRRRLWGKDDENGAAAAGGIAMVQAVARIDHLD